MDSGIWQVRNHMNLSRLFCALCLAFKSKSQPCKANISPTNAHVALVLKDCFRRLFKPEKEIRAKKDTRTQRFHPKIPCLNPPFLGAFNSRNSLCSGCVFPSKCRKNANTKNFEGGRGGQKKIFVLGFFGCFFSLFKEKAIRWEAMDHARVLSDPDLYARKGTSSAKERSRWVLSSLSRAVATSTGRFQKCLPSLRCQLNHFLSGPVLRDTARLSQRYPPIARYGVVGVSTWQIGCDTPSPFSERFPLREHAKWRCDTPPP